MMHPIWKDYFVTFGESAESTTFAIEADGVTIYTGKAFKRPDESYIKVKINDICADYLPKTRPVIEEEFVHGSLPIFSIVDGVGREVDSVQFYADWSYDEYESNNILSMPINGKVCNRMLLPTSVTINPSAEIETEITRPDGSISLLIGNADEAVAGLYLQDLKDTLPGEKLATTMVSTEQYIPEVINYSVIDSCARFALYYLNARGGWDALLIEGNHSETESLTRYTREIEHDNRDRSNRGRSNYANEIVKRMTLHTSWLSDDESSRMHHLLNSSDVYLFDMEQREFIPVLLTNTTTEHKTFKGNGGRLVNYAIEVELANKRIRR